MYNYRLSKLANKDLKNIALYTLETFGILQTEKYLNNIEFTIAQLQKMPTIGNYKQQFDCYSLKAGKHIILYNFDEVNQEIFIYRFLHKKMDIKSKFNK